MRRRSSSVPHVPDPIISFVGAYSEGLPSSAGTTSTLTFGGNLTGGIASSPSQGDLIIAYASSKQSASNVPSFAAGQDAGWSNVGSVAADDTQDVTLISRRIIAPSSVPTQVSWVTLNSGACAMGVHVFRGVNTSTPISLLDTISIINSGKVNPPAISTTNPEVVTFAIGAASGEETLQTPGNGYWLDDLTSTELDGFNLADGGGHHKMAAGYSRTVRDPAEWGGGGTDTRCSAVAMTMAINPE